MVLTAPINLELHLTGSDYSDVKLEWLAPLHDSVLVIGYSIEISEEGQIWTPLINNTNSKLTSYVDQFTSNGITRYYRVRAITSNEISAPSNFELISIPALPKPIANVYLDVHSETALTLSWRILFDPCISHYEIQQTHYTHNVKTYLTQEAVLDLINLDPDTLYKYQIRVKSKYGYSAWSDPITARTLRVPYAPEVSNKTEYINGNSPLSWTYSLFKEIFKFSIVVGNTGTIYGYSISDSIGNTAQTINLPSFLFQDGSSARLTDFTIDGDILTIIADGANWLSDLSDYYFVLRSDTTVLDMFNVTDENQEFIRDLDDTILRLNNYDGEFSIASYLNNVIDVYVYDIDPTLTGNNGVPEVLDYQIEGSYNNVNWHVLDSNITTTSYSIYHTNPPLVNVRVAGRNDLGLGDYG